MKKINLSDQMRRAQPLLVKAVGFVCNRGVAAWANWDRVEVKTEEDQVLLRYEADGHLLHPNVEFINNRYVVLPVGTGIMTDGFKVYDFQADQWTLDVAIRQGETGFCGAHPTAPVIAVEESDGLCLWDLSKSLRSRTLSIPLGINVAALGGPEEGIAVGDYKIIRIYDQGGEILSLHASGSEVTALAWNESLEVLLCGNVAGDIFEVDCKSSGATRSLGHIRSEIQNIRVSRNGNAAVAIGYNGEAVLMSFENSCVTRQDGVFDVAFSPIDEESILMAKTTGMERFAISMLGDR